MELHPIPNHASLPDMPSSSNTDHDGRYYKSGDSPTFSQIDVDSVHIDNNVIITTTADDLILQAFAGQEVIINDDWTATGQTCADLGTVTGATSITTNALVATTADIDGGTIDGTSIGAGTPAAGIFTNLTSGNVTVGLTNDQIISTTAGDLVLKASDGQEVIIFDDWDATGQTCADLGNVTIGTFANEGLHLLDTNASHDLIIKPGSDLSADRILTITTGNAARTITLSGNPTLNDWFDQAVKVASTPTFAGLTLSGNLALAGNSITGTSVDISNAELQQLSNIGAATISGTQWGYLGAMDQGLAVADTPTFGKLTISDATDPTIDLADSGGSHIFMYDKDGGGFGGFSFDDTVLINNLFLSSAATYGLVSSAIGKDLRIQTGGGGAIVNINNTWAASGQTCNDLGTVTTAIFTDAEIQKADDARFVITENTGTTNDTAGLYFRTASNLDRKQKGGVIFQDNGGSFGRGDLHLAVNITGNNDNATVADSRLKIDGLTGDIGITGSLDIGGGLQVNLVHKTGAYTATVSDYTITCDASGGAFTITLPAVASHTDRIYHIKKVDNSANAVTVDANGAETIDDALTAVLTVQYESITIQSDGSEWWII